MKMKQYFVVRKENEEVGEYCFGPSAWDEAWEYMEQLEKAESWSKFIVVRRMIEVEDY